MAEVLGAVSAAAGLLEVAIHTIKRVRKACERQRNLTEVLDKQTIKLKEIRKIVQMIEKEDALQTANVVIEVNKLQVIETELLQCLKKLNSTSTGTIQQLAHQFAHGSKDEKTLADIMDDLDRAKSNICLCIQLANVGLTRTINNTVLANAKVVNRIDNLLVRVIGEGRGLKIAGLLKYRTPQGSSNIARISSQTHIVTLADDGYVHLSKDEIASLSLEDSGTIDGEAVADFHLNGTTDRIIVKNSAKNSAVQILGPVGKDIWESLNVRVEENEATDKAVQVAYATDFQTFKFLVERQDRIVAGEGNSRR